MIGMLSFVKGIGVAGTYIPATQRPDGSWRKARRVKEGYVPQEEVPLYESKGKQWAKSQSAYTPGLNPIVTEATSQFPSTMIPGLTTIVSDVTKSSKKKKKKKTKSEDSSTVNNVAEEIDQLKISPQTRPEIKNTTSDRANADPVKKLKNLKKKMREIENLESRIQSGELATPEKEQLDKIARKEEIETLIEDLEAEIENS